MNISLQFIADKAKVSTSLVSQVLNQKPVRVSDATKARIIKIAKKYDYTPNQMAASLRTKRTNMIALILPFAYIEFFGKLIYFIQTRAREAGYSVLVCNTFENADIEEKYIGLYRSNMVDGIIIAPLALDKNVQMYKNINEAKFPLVFVDRYFPNLVTNYVCTDNVNGAYQGVKKLINEGCRNIYLIYRNEIIRTTIYKDRHKGYKKAMTESGLKEYIKEIPFDEGSVGNTLLEKLAGIKQPDAFFIMSSYDLSLLYDVCKDVGYDHENLKFLAFDNHSITSSRINDEEFMKFAKAPLTIIDQNAEEMGQQAFELLRKKIDGEEVKSVLIHPVIID